MLTEVSVLPTPAYGHRRYRTSLQSVDNSVHATEIARRFSLFCYYCGIIASNLARKCYIFTQFIVHKEAVSIRVLTTDRYLSQNTINLFSPI